MGMNGSGDQGRMGTDADGQQGEATTGVSPEADDLRGGLARISAWRDIWLPGKELWLSEFGIVRGFLAVTASGFDRAHVFVSRDSWDESPGKFATSGLVHDNDGTNEAKHAHKTSWYWVNTLHKTLRNFRFDSDLSPGGDIHVFRDTDASGKPRLVVGLKGNASVSRMTGIDVRTIPEKILRVDGRKGVAKHPWEPRFAKP